MQILLPALTLILWLLQGPKSHKSSLIFQPLFPPASPSTQQLLRTLEYPQDPLGPPWLMIISGLLRLEILKQLKFTFCHLSELSSDAKIENLS